MIATAEHDQHDQHGSGQLGQIVSWQVPKEVSISDLRDALRAADLDPGMAADMAPQNALKRAFAQMKEGRIIRQLRRDGDEIWFQFTAEHLDDKEVTYDKEAELSLDVSTGWVWCSVDELRDQASQLLCEHQNKRMTSDLTRLVQKIYESRLADLIPIREQGGAYFVPDMHREVVDKTRTLLREIGGNLRTFAVRLGSDDTSESVAESLNEYLVQLVEQFKASCADVTGDSSDRIVDHRQNRLAELRRKLECYQGLLGEWSGAIQSHIESAEQEFLRKIVSSPQAAESPAEPPAEPQEQETSLFAS